MCPHTQTHTCTHADAGWDLVDRLSHYAATPRGQIATGGGTFSLTHCTVVHTGEFEGHMQDALKLRRKFVIDAEMFLSLTQE